MSENQSDSKFLTGFLLGVLVGALLCLGAGGSFVFIRMQGAERQARAMEAEREARNQMKLLEAARWRDAEEAKLAAEKAKEGK